MRVDTFSVPTWPDYSYTFPPPPLISKTLTKIKDDVITVLIIRSYWMGVAWWDRLMIMALIEPMRLGKSRDTCIAKTGVNLLSRLGTIVGKMVQGKGRTHTASEHAGQYEPDNSTEEH